MSVVLKFGGSSLATASQIQRVAKLVEQALPRSPVLVLSACGRTTSSLIGAARAAGGGDWKVADRRRQRVADDHREIVSALFGGPAPATLERRLNAILTDLEVLLRGVSLLRELTPRSLDAIAASGELMSTAIVAALLDRQVASSTLIDARQLIVTDDRFGAARPCLSSSLDALSERLAPLLGPDRIVVTQGYIGANANGLTTTLGRGGSDLSATVLGAALGSDEVQIWTDVEGVLTCDPRIAPDAQPIPRLSYAEAAELAAFGAEVLHPATIQPAVEAGIPVTVRHTNRPAAAFTTITNEQRSLHLGPVTALASRRPVTVVTVRSARMLDQSGFLARLFAVFDDLDISVDLVATAEVSVSLTVDPEAPLDRLVAELSRFAEVEVTPDRSLVALVGERVRSSPGLAAMVFGALTGSNVEMISMGANEINLSLVVAAKDCDNVLRVLHRRFFPWRQCA